MPLKCNECKIRPRLEWVGATMCRECHREYKRVQEFYRRQQPRPCPRCRQMMPAGRTPTYCKPCAARQQRARRHRFGRLCQSCREPLKRTRNTDLCSTCSSLAYVERRLRAAGQAEPAFEQRGMP